jgi:putative addiction module CopG family antidote
MPTRNVSLTRKLDQFVAAEVEGGLYSNASEVTCAVLWLLEREKREYEEKLAALRAATAQATTSKRIPKARFMASNVPGMWQGIQSVAWPMWGLAAAYPQLAQLQRQNAPFLRLVPGHGEG